ncbi:MAG TPA: amidohydrolase family protein, partial [Gemmatimonadales bacterium]|nr:amidohydrolase family protein [Gemmatimonadales bacterium]
MSPSKAPTQFGRIFAPDDAWLARQPREPVLDPDLPIIDAHHHLWHRPDHRYLLDEFLADVRTGHNVVATVFIECHAMYRADGPAEMRPVGETEFVTGVAAMSASGAYGPARVAAGIVGFADLTLGDRVEPVLEAHVRAGGGRFRGVRHAGGWDPSDVIGNSHAITAPHLFLRSDFRAGLRRLTALGLSFDAWVFHPQLADIIDLARAMPDANIIMGHVGGPLGYGPYGGRRDEVFASWKASMTELAKCANVTLKLGGMLMRLAAFDYKAMEAPPSSAELAAFW